MHVIIPVDMLLQDILADTVQDAFKDLVYIMQGDLYQSMPAFLADNDNDNEAGKDFRLFLHIYCHRRVLNLIFSN